MSESGFPSRPSGPLRGDVLLAVALGAATVLDASMWNGFELARGLRGAPPTLAVCLLVPWRRVVPGAVLAGGAGLYLAVSAFLYLFMPFEPADTMPFMDFGDSLSDDEWSEATLSPIASALTAFVVVMGAVRWSSTSAVVLVLPVSLAAGVAGTGLASGSAPSWIEAAAHGGVWVVGILAGVTVRQQDQVEQREHERARSDEREGLARDVHDSVAHHVSAMIVQANAGHTVANRDPEAARRALEQIRETGKRALDELRGLVTALREEAPALNADERLPQPEQADLDVLLQGLVAEPLTLELELDLPHGKLPAAVSSSVFRIVQEAVTNTRRHAQDAQHVSVRVHDGGDELCLRVEDDGALVGSRRNKGRGLRGMKERVQLFDGTLAAGPLATRGWYVEARLPLRRPRFEGGSPA